MSSKFVVGALGAWLVSTVLTSDVLADANRLLAAAAAPCEPTLGGGAARPKAPTNLRIIPGDDDVSGPFADFDWSGEFAAAVAAHPYFDTLSARSDCLVAYHLRSDAQIDAIETVKSGISEKGEMRFPVSYDAANDAALFRIDPRVGSTDSEGKRVATAATSGSWLLTWDLRFDNGHAYTSSSHLGRHKTYMVGWRGATSGDNRWLGLKTEYINAAQAGQGVAEIYTYMVGTTYHGPGTTLGPQSSIQPRTGSFFINANTWTRVWIFVEDIGQALSYVSVWVADTSRGPVQLHNRNAVITPEGGINKFWFEYDTSGEDAANGEMRSWNRNLVVLKNVTAAQVAGLLQRP
jgi:hypothetical protein